MGGTNNKYGADGAGASIDPFEGIGSRWVAWRSEMRKGKPAKMPVNPATGRYAKTDDPSTWASRKAAKTRAGMLLEDGGKGGIGIVLGDLGDGTHLCGVDLDGCRNPATGELEPWATNILDNLRTLLANVQAASLAKRDVLVCSKDRPPHQAPRRSMFRAAAEAMCCRRVLAKPR